MKTKTLPTVNQKSIYAAAGLIYAEVKDDDKLSDPFLKATIMLKALHEQNVAYIAELKRRQLDQIDKLNNIRTHMRNIEIKAFDELPQSNDPHAITETSDSGSE